MLALFSYLLPPQILENKLNEEEEASGKTVLDVVADALFPTHELYRWLRVDKKAMRAVDNDARRGEIFSVFENETLVSGIKNLLPNLDNEYKTVLKMVGQLMPVDKEPNNEFYLWLLGKTEKANYWEIVGPDKDSRREKEFAEYNNIFTTKLRHLTRELDRERGRRSLTINLTAEQQATPPNIIEPVHATRKSNKNYVRGEEEKSRTEFLKKFTALIDQQIPRVTIAKRIDQLKSAGIRNFAIKNFDKVQESRKKLSRNEAVVFSDYALIANYDENTDSICIKERGHYRIFVVLKDIEAGIGASGDVFLAQDLDDEEEIFTVKYFRDHVTDDEFNDELYFFKFIESNKKIPLYVIDFHQDRRFYLIMKHGGIPLIDLISIMPVQQRQQTAIELGKLIVHLQKYDVVHADIKPRNVLMSLFLDDLIRLNLIDYGSSRDVRETSRTTCPTGYLAPPEFQNGEARLRPETDMYLLGENWMAILAGFNIEAKDFKAELQSAIFAAYADFSLSDNDLFNLYLVDPLRYWFARYIKRLCHDEIDKRPDAEELAGMLHNLEKYLDQDARLIRHAEFNADQITKAKSSKFKRIDLTATRIMQGFSGTSPKISPTASGRQKSGSPSPRDNAKSGSPSPRDDGALATPPSRIRLTSSDAAHSSPRNNRKSGERDAAPLSNSSRKRRDTASSDPVKQITRTVTRDFNSLPLNNSGQ